MKAILVMALAATLVLGTFSASSAFAVEAGDQFNIKSRGSFTCTDQTGEDCQGGRIDSKIELLVQHVGEDAALGIGRAEINLRIHQMTGLELKGDSLGFSYDPFGNIMAVQGDLKASNGSTWQLEMDVSFIGDTENSRIKADCSTMLTAPDGATIHAQDSSCGVVLTPISG